MPAATANTIWERWLRQALVRAILLLTAVGVIVFIRHQIEVAHHQRIEPPQHVTLLEEPPPPSPPPEELMQLPETPEQQVEIEELDMPDELPPLIDDSLGLDTAGTAGADSFGLQAKRGGRDLLGTGQSRMNPLLEYQRFATLVERSLQDQLSQHEGLRHRNYNAVVSLWITPDGHIQRCEIDKSTGSPEIDLQLRSVLTSSCELDEGPPVSMPQPLRIRISVFGSR